MDTKPKLTDSERDKKVETTSTSKDPRMNDLLRREKWLEVYDKLKGIDEKRRKSDLDAMEQSLKIETLEKELKKMDDPSLFNLFMATQLTVIDEQTTIGSEMRYRNLFEDEDMDLLKKEILDLLLKRKRKANE